MAPVAYDLVSSWAYPGLSMDPDAPPTSAGIANYNQPVPVPVLLPGDPEQAAGMLKLLDPRETQCADANESSYTYVSPNLSPLILRAEPVRLAPPNISYQSRLLQQWEGTVTWISEEEFGADLRDLTNPAFRQESATFSVDEVADEDRSLFLLGAIFYWNIGYETSKEGQKKKVSFLRFRRLPAWSERDLVAVRREAEKLHHFLTGNGAHAGQAPRTGRV